MRQQRRSVTENKDEHTSHAYLCSSIRQCFEFQLGRIIGRATAGEGDSGSMTDGTSDVRSDTRLPPPPPDAPATPAGRFCAAVGVAPSGCGGGVAAMAAADVSSSRRNEADREGPSKTPDRRPAAPHEFNQLLLLLLLLQP